MTDLDCRAVRLRSVVATGIALIIISPFDDMAVAAVVGWTLPVPMLTLVMVTFTASTGWLALTHLRRE